MLHGYANGDWVFITGCQGMTQLNDSFYIVRNVTTNTFTLTDLYGNNIDATAFGAYVPGTGSVARVYTLATPYAAADLPLLKFTQSADVMSLVHPSYAPYDLARVTANHWTLTKSTFSASTVAPAVLIAQATVHPSTATSPPTLPAAYAYVVTAVDAATGQESIASPVANVTDSVDISSSAGSIVISWSAVSTAGIYNIYKAPTSYNTNPGSTTNALPVPAGAPFGYIGSSYGNQFVDSNITADYTQVPPLHSNPFAPGQITSLPVTALGSGYTTAAIAITTSTGSGLVAEPVILSGQILSWIITNGGHDYAPGDTATVTGDGAASTASVTVGPTTGTDPGCVAYFQQRRVYANSTNSPDTYWMSQPGAFLNFDTSIPVTASDAITGTPWAQQVNGIQAMVPMPGGLVALTGTGAWQITGAGGSAINPQPITPSSQQAQPQAFNGCHQHVPPITVNYDILYVQSKGSLVRDLQYNYWVNIYTGSDLTELSSHLFNNYNIQEWAWCEEPYKIVWAVRDDGTMLSLTYVKEQEVFGWARHDTNGQFVSVCSVTEPPVDALYIATARCVPQTSAGTAPVYYIERMDNRVWRTSEDPWCVDCGVAYFMPQPNAILLASSSTGAVTFTATAAVFSPSSVSQVIRMGGGIATVSLYTSPTVVSGTWNLPPVLTVPNDPRHYVVPAQAGQWSITPQTQKVSGLQHSGGTDGDGLGGWHQDPADRGCCGWKCDAAVCRQQHQNRVAVHGTAAKRLPCWGRAADRTGTAKGHNGRDGAGGQGCKRPGRQQSA